MTWNWHNWPWSKDPVTTVKQHVAREQAQRIVTGNFERPDHTGRLTNGELDWVDNNVSCPFCHCDLWQGPQGGMATNLFCSNEACGTRFNYVPRMILDYTGAVPKEVYSDG